jgi:hypothetical protein
MLCLKILINLILYLFKNNKKDYKKNKKQCFGV